MAARGAVHRHREAADESPSLTIRRPSAIGSLLERRRGGSRFRVPADPVRASDGRPAGGTAACSATRRRSRDQAQIDIHHREALARLLVGGETGGGEAYMDGLWSSPDLAALLRLAARNREALARDGLVPRADADPPDARASDRRNTRRAAAATSRPTTTWATTSTAVPRRDDDLLERRLRDARPDARRRAAQQVPAIAAGRAVARPARLEIGSGWGGFALYAAGRTRLVRVTTITISREQYDPRAASGPRSAGSPTSSKSNCAITATSNRTYNAIVWIEMLEAVGAEYFGTFFQACDRALRTRWTGEPPGGSPSRTWPTSRSNAELNSIQRYVFPGGLLPVAGRVSSGRAAWDAAAR